MKKMIVLAAVALATTSAYASKARLASLQSSVNILDTRDVINWKPDQAMYHGEFAAMELAPSYLSSSATNTNGTVVAGTPNAEGGFVRKLGDDYALGAHLGSKDTALGYRALNLAGNTYSYKIQNPLNVYFANKIGDLSWGVSLQYANSEDKVAKSKSSLTGLTGSVTSTNWNAQLGLGITGEATIQETTKIEQKQPLRLSGGYWIDSLYLYGSYTTYGQKTKVSGDTAADEDASILDLRVINSHKKDGSDFFYGVSYVATSDKVKDGTNTESTSLPLIVGIEAEASSWLVLRGSITQSILISSNKVTPNNSSATTDTSLADDTKVAAGLGLKFGKFTLDGTLAATNATATAGKLGSDANFIADLGMTYRF